ncbi:hypothetical protein [Candidatus Palauibacter sp.]|uniref:hypothetical protein n=1 Tax=Candidatus Palauibacter sp. TaxID=3101350 RepID=UPI003C6EE26F
MDTLRWAEQGYLIDNSPSGVSVRPMSWRLILHHLSTLGADELLRIESGRHGSESDIVVRRIVANGRSGPRPFAANGSRRTTCTVDARERLWAKTRFAQRIEMAVRSGEYRHVTCMRRGSTIFAMMTGPPAPAAPSNGPPPIAPRVHAGGSPKGLSRTTLSRRQNPGNRYERHQVIAASLLLSVAALISAMAGRNEDPPPRMPANDIVGQVLIEGRGADGLTVALDGRAATATAIGGWFRFDDVEAGTHTITIGSYPANARFDRTSATATVADDGGPTTVRFSGSYISTSPIMGTARVEGGSPDGGHRGRTGKL